MTRHKERWEVISEQMDSRNIDYERFNAIDGRDIDLSDLRTTQAVVNDQVKRGEVGCYLSHYTIWQQIIHNKWSRVAIFEDDCFFSEGFDARWPIESTILRELSFDLCYLGCYPMYSSILANGLVRVSYALQTHAYILTLEGAEKLIPDMMPIRGSLDVVMNDVPNFERIAYLPNLVDAHLNGSSTQE